jgi:hypothetical protein
MLDQQLKILKITFVHLSPGEQQDCEEVLKTLIRLIEESTKVQKPYLKEVRRYLSNKFNREQHNNEPLDLFKLRNLLVHRHKYPLEYHEQVSQVIWAMLPGLRYFETAEYLNNFLGNILHKTVANFDKISTKPQLVAAYKKLYEAFDRTKQEQVMKDLATSILRAAQRDELKQFNEIMK